MNRTRAYFDFGAHHGDGLRQMTEILGIDASWEIYLFEPNPFTDTIASLAGYPHPFQFVRAAIWTDSGSIEFLPQAMIDDRCPVVRTASGLTRQPLFDGMGSAVSAATSCEPGLGHMRVQVAAMSVADALAMSSCEDLYIKMDIEASEYEVLPALLQSPAASRVRHAYVEWHRTRDGQHDRRRAEISARAPFPITDWH